MESGLRTSVIRTGSVPLRVGWRLPAARPRASVVILPGRAEFIEKYDEVVADLLARELAVGMLEWRGQGLSHRALPNRLKGHSRRFEDYLDDLDHAAAWLERAGLPGPWLMLGHSMGGHLGLRFLQRGRGRFAGAVLTAPMFGINLRGVSEPTARLIAGAAVRLGLGGRYAPRQGDIDPILRRFEGNPLTHSPERFARFRALIAARPELALGGVTYGWLHAGLASMRAARGAGRVEAVDVPVLVCRSGRERIVCNSTMAALTERFPAGRLVTFDEAAHEIMQELDPIRDRFFAAFDGFVERVVGATQRLTMPPAA